MTANPSARIDHLHIDRGDNPFALLTHEQRMRLIVRVLCELVAYDEVTDAAITEESVTDGAITDGASTAGVTSEQADANATSDGVTPTTPPPSDDLTDRLAS